MPYTQAQFVHEENIRHLENKLRTETDPAMRELIRKLLEEEKGRRPGDSDEAAPRRDQGKGST